MDLKETIQKYLPELPELVKLLKAKFSNEQIFLSADGELIYEGELAIGVDVFAKQGVEECILKETEKGMSKEEAKTKCSEAGGYSKVPAPTKTYKHEDGTEVVVEAGKVVDIKKPKAPETPATDFTAFANELFKAFPKTDLTAIEASLSELKATLSAISLEKTELKAKVDKFENFKTEVISILEKFSAEPSAKSTQGAKTNSANEQLSLEDWRNKFMKHQP